MKETLDLDRTSEPATDREIEAAENNKQKAMREALEVIATMPLSQEFETDERGRIKSGSRSWGPGWAAWHFQQLAQSALSNGNR